MTDVPIHPASGQLVGPCVLGSLYFYIMQCPEESIQHITICNVVMQMHTCVSISYCPFMNASPSLQMDLAELACMT